MPKKVASSKAKIKAPTKVKVVSNRSKSGGTSLLRSKGAALTIAFAFMLVGAGTLTWVRAATTTSTLWSTTTVPKIISDSDTQSVELGTKFRAKYSGEILGVRFYKGPQNTGVHTGNLWSGDGRKLASVVFTNETASGWQTANFATPVAISANTTYTVSYLAPKGHYSANNNYFTRAYANGPLTALRNGGVYAYSGKSSFPRQTYQASNYWVDVVYSTSRFSPTPKPEAPSDLKATISGTSIKLTWKPSVSTGVMRYELLRGGAALKSDITGTTWTDAGLAAGTSYSYQVRAYDGTGVASSLSNTATATIPTAPTPAPTPTPTPIPTPTPGQTSRCPLPKYPTVACTGVPAGISLQTVSGDMVVTTPGQVVDGKQVTGMLIVRAHDVVIKNSEIYGGVINDSTSTRYRFTIEDSNVGRENACGAYLNGAIGVSDYTARRVRLLNFSDGFRVAGSNITIEDSYVKLCTNNPSEHSDGLQAYGAANGTNITIRHNTIDQRAVTNGAANAPIFIPTDGERQGNTNITVNVMDNMLAGGGYVLRVYGELPFSAPNVTGNKIVNNTWEYGPVDVTCSSIGSWSGNAVVTYDFNTGMILSQVRSLDDCN